MSAEKCQKQSSIKLTHNQLEELEILFDRYRRVRNLFYSRFSGIKSMLVIQNAKKLRTNLSNEQKEKNYLYAEMFGVLQRHWVMALFDACSNINSMWTNLSLKLKEYIRDNENLTKDEKSYVYYILSVRSYWYEVLNYIPIKENERLSSFKVGNKEKIYRLIRRLTRNHKPKIAHSENIRCIQLDEMMYKYLLDDEKNKTKITIMSYKKNIRVVINVKGKPVKQKGNIQLILDRENKRIFIHKMLKINTKENKNKKNDLGVDKGYTTFFSCSSGNEYGKEKGILITNEAERLNKIGAKRNLYTNKIKELNVRIKEIDGQLNQKEEVELLEEKRLIQKKIKNIKENNLGKKKYNNKHKKAIENIGKEINIGIKQMIKEEKMTELIKEELTFSNWSNKRGKQYNRKMSMWVKGIIDERLDYLCKLNSIKVISVNPAYTSQICNKCGSFVTRSGKHNEICNCKKCGQMNANINAGINIKNRKNDSEISLYTPYKRVKEILLKRIS